MHSMLLVESMFCNDLPRIERYDITQELPHIQIYLIIYLINVFFFERVGKMVFGKYLTRLGAIFGGQLPKALTED